MHAARSIVGALFAVAVSTPASAAIREEPVSYKDGDTVMKGFVVYDDATQAKRPGIVVVHEWWGITKHVHDSARSLAAMGYTAFIADMYGEGKTADNPKTAGELSALYLLHTDPLRSMPARGQWEAAQAVGLSRAQNLRHVVLPSAAPMVLTGLQVALAAAFSTVVSAELMAATDGLGWMVISASTFLMSCWKSSVRATKSVSQLSSIMAPIRPAWT